MTPFQAMAKAMADELERSRLTVELVPTERRTNAGGKVRRAVETNPEWYQRFCAEHTSARKDGGKWRVHKTSIKRRYTIRALRAIADGRQQQMTGGVGPATYAEWLKPIIEAEMEAEQERADAEAESICGLYPEAPL